MSFLFDPRRIALGTVQFGLDYGISNTTGKPSLNRIESILDYASEQGVTLLDTANAYGDAEHTIGLLHANRFDIVSKFMPESLNGSIERQLNDSLNKLKVKSLYAYLAHRPLDVVENLTIWEKLLAFKQENKIKKVGFSFNTLEEYYKVKDASINIDLVQLPYNYFDQRFEGIIEELSEKGCEVHVRSTFLQGLFFMEPQKLELFFDEVKAIIQDLQDTHGVFLSSALLRYILENKSIDKVVLGVQDEFQLAMTFKNLTQSPLLKKLDINISNNILQPSLWPK
jgi:aryl-alcohol dehydrogenase-like predicted oxidoreductase